jgi:hypothetical protein
MNGTVKLMAVCGVICVCLAGSATQADVIFADDFNDPDGTLLSAHTPTTGTGWDVTDGTPIITNDSVNTYFSGDPNSTFAYGTFTMALGTGMILDLTFSSLDPFPGEFANEGWAGISLYTGGITGVEEFFMGNPAF